MAAFTPWRSGFPPRAEDLGFVFNKLPLRQNFIRVVRLYPVSSQSINVPYSIIYHSGYAKYPIGTKVLQMHSLTLSQVDKRIKGERNVLSLAR